MAPKPKRTYSRYNLSIAKTDVPLSSGSPATASTARKRRKLSREPLDAMHPSHVLNGGGRPRSRQKNNGKNDRKSFSGPTSIPSGETDVEEQDDEFASFHGIRRETRPPPQRGSLYGGGSGALKSISAEMKGRRREETKKSQAHARENSPPHGENEAPIHAIEHPSYDINRRIEHPCQGTSRPSERQSSLIDLGSEDMDTDTESLSSVTIGELAERLSAKEASARIFAGREYTAPQAAPPRKNLYNDRIQPESAYATAWTSNQASPLLRLPANVRRSIFEYALGGNSIEIGFVTYLKSGLPHRRVHTPYFQWTSNVYSSPCNPFAGTVRPLKSNWKSTGSTPFSTGMTLLNGVCRQLYLETYTLPYSLNTFYFNSHNALFNFIVKEDRLQPQQCAAITKLSVLFETPAPAVLKKMPNLQVVLVTGLDDLNHEDHPKQLGHWNVVHEGRVPRLEKRILPMTSNGIGYGRTNGPGGGYKGPGRNNGHGNRSSRDSTTMIRRGRRY